MSIISSPPKLITRYFNDIIWGNVIDKVILTFDDGPHPTATKKVLSVLAKHNLKAIFFLVGEKVLKFPDLVIELIKNGHKIANHSFTHSKSLFLKTELEIFNEIKYCQDVIDKFDQSNKGLKLFRPPYGILKGKMKKIVNDLSLRTMMWSLLSQDYLLNEKRVIENLKTKMRSNSIIVFHDNEKTKNKIDSYLKTSIEIIQDKGFRFDGTFSF